MARASGPQIHTVNEILDGQTAMDLSSLDRIYLNGYVPMLQTSGYVARFIREQRGMPIPSPAAFEKIGSAFRDAVKAFAKKNAVPLISFKRGDRKHEVMRPYFTRAARNGKGCVVAIGVAQEIQRVFVAHKRMSRDGFPQFDFYRADRAVSCYYFYIWDDQFGTAFIKICSYFPYPMKVWLNGHEWAKRQAAKEGLAYQELSNGFASCEDQNRLQEICNNLTYELIQSPSSISRSRGLVTSGRALS